MRLHLLCAAMLLAAAQASAQPAPDEPPPPAGYDQGAPPPGYDQPPPPSGYAPSGGAPHMRFKERFEAANTTHDGRLTLAQAQAAGMRPIVRHFSEMDVQNKGYVTLDDVRAWRQAHPGHHQPPAEPPPAQ